MIILLFFLNPKLAQILKTFIAGHISEVDVDWSSSHEECRTEQQQSSLLRALKEAGAKRTVRTVVENVERRGVFFGLKKKVKVLDINL